MLTSLVLLASLALLMLSLTHKTIKWCYNVQIVTNSINLIATIAHWSAVISTQIKKKNTINYGIDPSGEILFHFESQCKGCDPGFIKRLVISSCCGTCDPCLGPNITITPLISALQCEVCPETMWGNNPLTGSTDCVHDESYLKPSDIWSIVLIITAIIGFLATAFVGAVFIWNTPIVKSSGREHMILRITFSFLITIVSQNLHQLCVVFKELACGFAFHWSSVLCLQCEADSNCLNIYTRQNLTN